MPTGMILKTFYYVKGANHPSHVLYDSFYTKHQEQANLEGQNVRQLSPGPGRDEG